MSGPALKNVDSHTSIHDAALGEAKELIELINQCLHNGEKEHAFEVAKVALEHWESRTLEHANSEEEGLYREIAQKHPELQPSIVALTRDHSLMRKLAAEIKGMLEGGEISDRVVSRFQAMILIDELHNEDELKLVGHAMDQGNDPSLGVVV